MSFRTRSRYRPYQYSRSFNRRATGQFKAAQQQRDTTKVVINANYAFSCGQTFLSIDDTEKNFYDTSCMAINIYDILRNSEYYGYYSNMYDQVKIDNVRAKIIATNWQVSSNNNSTPSNEKINEIIRGKSYVIVTAWDRSGLSESQIVKNPDWDENDPETQVFWTTIGKDIATYSSANTKHLGPGNSYEIIRQLYPSSINEKNQYISTKLLIPQQTRVNDNKFTYKCWYNKKNNDGTLTKGAFDFKNKYPCNLLSSNEVTFKPTLLVNVISGPDPSRIEVLIKDSEGFETVEYVGINKILPVTFDVEFDIAVTFRGLRYNRIIKENIEVATGGPSYPVASIYPGEADNIGPTNYTDIELIQFNNTISKGNGMIEFPYTIERPVEIGTVNDDKKKHMVVILNCGGMDINSIKNIIEVKQIPNNVGTVELDDGQILIDHYICDIESRGYLNMQFYKYVEGDNVVCYEISIPLDYDRSYFLNSYLNYEYDYEDEED